MVRFPFLSLSQLLYKDIFNDKNLINLGYDLVEMFLAHTFYNDTIKDES